MAERMTGGTAVYYHSMYSGIIIKVLDEDTLLVQEYTYGPKYSEPEERPILWKLVNSVDGDEDDSVPYFEWYGEEYYLDEFIREDYP